MQRHRFGRTRAYEKKHTNQIKQRRRVSNLLLRISSFVREGLICGS
ncbi:hypothetical protein glysoja_046223 [Glycine soja]|uniref:Uncharacterized protein n=1 Tax=Glycine soja TaxID=3848 RepID=A0A0B2P7G3_GLYSO|nr:hypothetical protein glysoja_046223 [Glycine soja]